MITTTLLIAEKVNGKLFKGAADIEVSAVSTDTRTLEDGQCTLALKGPNLMAMILSQRQKKREQVRLSLVKT